MHVTENPDASMLFGRSVHSWRLLFLKEGMTAFTLLPPLGSIDKETIATRSSCRPDKSS